MVHSSSTPTRRSTAPVRLAKSHRRRHLEVARAAGIAAASATSVTTAAADAATSPAPVPSMFPFRECPRSIATLLDEARRRKLAGLRNELLPREELSMRELIVREVMEFLVEMHFLRISVRFHEEFVKAMNAWHCRVSEELVHVESTIQPAVHHQIVAEEQGQRQIYEGLCTSRVALVDAESKEYQILLGHHEGLQKTVNNAASLITFSMRANALRSKAKKKRNQEHVRQLQADLAGMVEKCWIEFKRRECGRQQRAVFKEAFVALQAIEEEYWSQTTALIAEDYFQRQQILNQEYFDSIKFHLRLELEVDATDVKRSVYTTEREHLVYRLMVQCLQEGFYNVVSHEFFEHQHACLYHHEDLQRNILVCEVNNNPITSMAAWRAGWAIMSSIRTLHKKRQRQRNILRIERSELESYSATEIQKVWRRFKTSRAVDRRRIEYKESGSRALSINEELCEAESLSRAAVHLNQHVAFSIAQQLVLQELETHSRIPTLYEPFAALHELYVDEVLSHEEAIERQSLALMRKRGGAALTLYTASNNFIARRNLGQIWRLVEQENAFRTCNVESEEEFHRVWLEERQMAEYCEQTRVDRLEADLIVFKALRILQNEEDREWNDILTTFDDRLQELATIRDKALSTLAQTCFGYRSRLAFSQWDRHQKTEASSRFYIEALQLDEFTTLVAQSFENEHFVIVLSARKIGWSLQHSAHGAKLMELQLEEQLARMELAGHCERLFAVHEMEIQAMSSWMVSPLRSRRPPPDRSNESTPTGRKRTLRPFRNSFVNNNSLVAEDLEEYEEEEDEEEEEYLPTLFDVEHQEQADRRQGILIWAQGLAFLHSQFTDGLSTGTDTNDDDSEEDEEVDSGTAHNAEEHRGSLLSNNSALIPLLDGDKESRHATALLSDSTCPPMMGSGDNFSISTISRGDPHRRESQITVTSSSSSSSTISADVLSVLEDDEVSEREFGMVLYKRKLLLLYIEFKEGQRRVSIKDSENELFINICETMREEEQRQHDDGRVADLVDAFKQKRNKLWTDYLKIFIRLHIPKEQINRRHLITQSILHFKLLKTEMKENLKRMDIVEEMQTSEDLEVIEKSAEWLVKKQLKILATQKMAVEQLLHEESSERLSIEVEWESSSSYAHLVMMHQTLKALSKEEEDDEKHVVLKDHEHSDDEELTAASTTSSSDHEQVAENSQPDHSSPDVPSSLSGTRAGKSEAVEDPTTGTGTNDDPLPNTLHDEDHGRLAESMSVSVTSSTLSSSSSDDVADLLMDVEAEEYESRQDIGIQYQHVWDLFQLSELQECLERLDIGVEYESSSSYSKILMVHQRIQMMLETSSDEEDEDEEEEPVKERREESASSNATTTSSSEDEEERLLNLQADELSGRKGIFAAFTNSMALLKTEKKEGLQRLDIIVEYHSCSTYQRLVMTHEMISEMLFDEEEEEEEVEEDTIGGEESIVEEDERKQRQASENSILRELAGVHGKLAVPQEQLHRRFVLNQRVIGFKLLFIEHKEGLTRLQLSRSESQQRMTVVEGAAFEQQSTSFSAKRRASLSSPQTSSTANDSVMSPFKASDGDASPTFGSSNNLLGHSLFEVHETSRQTLLIDFFTMHVMALQSQEQLHRRHIAAERASTMKLVFAEYKFNNVFSTLWQNERLMRQQIGKAAEIEREKLEYFPSNSTPELRALLLEHREAKQDLIREHSRLIAGLRVPQEQINRRAILDTRIRHIKRFFIEHKEGVGRVAIERSVYRGPAWANVLTVYSDIDEGLMRMKRAKEEEESEQRDDDSSTDPDQAATPMLKKFVKVATSKGGEQSQDYGDTSEKSVDSLDCVVNKRWV